MSAIRLKPELFGADRMPIENTSLFFSLARELRDQIYDELWRMSPSTFFKHEDFILRVQYDGITDRSSAERLPTWLLANKAVWTEGLQQLSRKTECFWKKELRGMDERNKIPSLLLPTVFRNMTLDYGYPDIIKNFDTTGSPCYVLSMMYRCKAEGLSKGIRESQDLGRLGTFLQNSNLRVLRLRATLWPMSSLAVGNWRVDFSPMLQFSRQIQKLEIVLTVRGDPNTILTQALKQEAAKIGTTLVGGNARMQFTIKSKEDEFFSRTSPTFFNHNLGDSQKENEWRFEFVREEQ